MVDLLPNCCDSASSPTHYACCCCTDAAREKFFVPESDHLTLLHIYQQWKQNGYRSDWCDRHFLQAKGLRKAKEVCCSEAMGTACFNFIKHREM